MIGVSSDGQFRTAKLKEYSAAQTICDFLQVTTHREVQVHDEEWEAWYIKARATLAEIRRRHATLFACFCMFLAQHTMLKFTGCEPRSLLPESQSQKGLDENA